MDSRNYVCDYHFDWVEKIQTHTNKVFYVLLSSIKTIYLCY